MSKKSYLPLASALMLALGCTNGFAEDKNMSAPERCHALYQSLSELERTARDNLLHDCAATYKKAAQSVTEAGINIVDENMNAIFNLSNALRGVNYTDAIHCANASELGAIEDELSELMDWVRNQLFKKK
ncbi:hypothetical protein [Legionella sp. CNM-4043-24]|uniref:hypothetical protein n=1 Tax=Legionella sp. CNM-4043-24 TaxID=3421646 RepID=UPI00403AC54A